MTTTLIRSQWFIAIIITTLLLLLLFFPRSPLEILIILAAGILFGLLFALSHRTIRLVCRGAFSSASPTTWRIMEMVLGITFNPVVSSTVIILTSLIGGIAYGIFTGVNWNDPVERGESPLLILPTIFSGGLAGLSVIAYGLLATILAGVAGIIFAVIFPWIPLLIKAPSESAR